MFGQECSICLNESSDQHFLSECHHPFCKECITEWIRVGNTTCPNCRGSITEPDYSANNINPRCEVLQSLISNTIKYHYEELEDLEDSFNETIEILDNDDSVCELILDHTLIKFKKRVEQSTLNINNELRSVTQDDLDVIDSLEDKEYYHSLILDNILMNHNEYYLFIEPRIQRNRSFRKRKRDFFERDYSLKKESITESINFLKQI